MSSLSLVFYVLAAFFPILAGVFLHGMTMNVPTPLPATNYCTPAPSFSQVSGTNEVKANIKLRFSGRDGRVSE